MLGVERTYGGLVLRSPRRPQSPSGVGMTPTSSSGSGSLAPPVGTAGVPPADPARPARHVPRRPRAGVVLTRLEVAPAARPRAAPRIAPPSSPRSPNWLSPRAGRATHGPPSPRVSGWPSTGCPNPRLRPLRPPPCVSSPTSLPRPRTPGGRGGRRGAPSGPRDHAGQVERIGDAAPGPTRLQTPSESRPAIGRWPPCAPKPLASRAGDAAGWEAIAGAFDTIGRPYPAAYALFRSAAATLRDRASRADAERPSPPHGRLCAPWVRRPCSTERSTCLQRQARLTDVDEAARPDGAMEARQA